MLRTKAVVLVVLLIVFAVSLFCNAQPVTIISPDQHYSDKAIDVAYAIGDLPVYVGTTGSYGDSAVVACLNLDGSYAWRKTYGLGYVSRFNNVVRSDNGYLVVGAAVTQDWTGSRICVLGVSLEGDSLWSRLFGIPDMQFWPTRTMVIGDRVVVCGNVFDQTLGLLDSDGFMLSTGLTGDSLDYFQYSPPDDTCFYSFMAMHRNDLGNVGLIGEQMTNNSLERYVEVLGPEPELQSSWVSPGLSDFYWGLGAISEGEYLSSDSVSLYYIVRDSNLIDVELHHALVTNQNGIQTEVPISSWLNDRPLYTLGHISYADMDVVLGLQSTSMGSKHFLLATDIHGEVFWSYETEPVASGVLEDVGMALDSIKGILFVGGGHAGFSRIPS